MVVWWQSKTPFGVGGRERWAPLAGWMALWLGCLALALAGCGQDDGAGSQGAIRGILSPRIATSPEVLDFAAVTLGTQTSQTLTVFNTGQGVLRIASIRLVEDSPAGQEVYFRGPDWVGGNVVLEPDGLLSVSIAYRSRAAQQPTGHVEIVSNDASGNGVLRVPLRPPALRPEVFADSQVRFERVPAGSAQSQIMRVANIGQMPLRIDNLVLAGSPAFSMAIATSEDPQSADQDRQDWPALLDPNGQFLVRLTFAPDSDDAAQGELVVFTNDPARPELSVSLLGNSGAPCMKLSHEDRLSFGEASIGQQSSRVLRVENCSPLRELTLLGVAMQDDADGVFAIEPASLPAGLPEGPAVLGPGQSAGLVLLYTPVQAGPSTAILRLQSDDPAKREVELAIDGAGTDNQCPTALAEVRVLGTQRWSTGLTTLPLNTVELSAANSLDPDGQVRQYEWTVLQRPRGSLARPQNPAQATTPLYLDLAGTYEIELAVYDNQGLASCGQRALVTIQAIPQDDIHIQLVWDAPAVTAPQEGYGTDLDLHYLHPLGRWNDAPYDIHWNNPTGDWGVSGSTSDDPRLDIDDTWGTGPENVNHSSPQTDTNYAIGVYYFADNGHGAAYATVRIYLRGQLHLELENTYMPAQGHFWYAGFLQWPRGDFARRDRVEFGFPQY